uniref:DUF1618 domain-containing protein n=1 Tax=Oryza glaberrima TaxID=4538 RepID=I1PGD2_ORYGL
MATMGSAPSYVVLDRVVHLDKEAVKEESEWAIMECRDRKTYLRNDHVGDEVVYGLSLLAQIAEPPDLSKLSIRLSEPPPVQVAARPEEILDDGSSVLDLPKRALNLHTSVQSVADDLIVFTSCLRNRTHRYLVYDAIGKSLSMIPCLPNRCDPSATFQPLPLRAGAGGDYTIALLGRDMRSDRETTRRFFQDALPVSAAAILETSTAILLLRCHHAVAIQEPALPSRDAESLRGPYGVLVRRSGFLGQPRAKCPLLQLPRRAHRWLRCAIPLHPAAA